MIKYITSFLSWICVMKNKVENVDVLLSASYWELLMLFGMLKSPIMMWLSQRLADRTWNSSNNKEVEDEGGR